ncbi:DoxX family protein [Amycolatopsis ultiminotia]|uniref:DoxX family protein n=1 Tax=Amycolatopsis ultiminotia TaxID=543629 RepID=A0ABP6VHR7_9PSEU
MEFPYVVVAVVLAVVLVGSGAGKLARAKQVVENMTKVDVPDKLYPLMAGCEFAGAVGLVVGIWWPPLGIAAAIGVLLYFLLAVGRHVQKKDANGMTPAAVLLILAVAALVLRISLG